MSFANLKNENGFKYITEDEIYRKYEMEEKFQEKISGITTTFLTVDGKTVTVTNGMITSVE